MSNAPGRAGVVEESPEKARDGGLPTPRPSGAPARGGRAHAGEVRAARATWRTGGIKGIRASTSRQMAGGLSPSQLAKIRDTAGPDDVPPVGSDFQAHKNDWSYDDRPAVSKAAMHEAAGDAAFHGGVPGGSTSASVGGNNDEVPARDGRIARPLRDGRGVPRRGRRRRRAARGRRADPGSVPGTFPRASTDLPPPEPISSSLTAEASPVVEAFGEYAAACLYSKNWMHREAALHKMEGRLRAGR